jgi:hypothetical protein
MRTFRRLLDWLNGWFTDYLNRPIQVSSLRPRTLGVSSERCCNPATCYWWKVIFASAR